MKMTTLGHSQYFLLFYRGQRKKMCVLLIIVMIQVISSSASPIQESDGCPPWMITKGDECMCRDFSQGSNRVAIPTVFCDSKTHTAYVAVSVCVTYNYSGLEEDIIIGACPFIPVENIPIEFGSYRALPKNESELNDFMCGPFNRQGLLCSSCKPGYGVSVYSDGLPCAKCSTPNFGVSWYVLLELAPITVLYVIVVLFRIRATAPPLAGLVFFSQLLLKTARGNIFIYASMAYATNQYSYVLLQILLSLCGIWNLDFFRYLIPPFCVSESIDNYFAVVLEYVSALYPFVLVFGTYALIELHDHNVRPIVWLWKPLNRWFARFRKTWNIKSSIINAFSTFLLLSYSKMVSVSFRLLNFESIYNVNATVITDALLLDPTAQSIGLTRIPFTIMAVLIIFIFGLLPILLLVLYPTRLFRKCMGRCHCRVTQVVHTFVDTYQGYLKDGTNGTCDYRALSAVYLILRFALLSVYLSNNASAINILPLVVFSIVLMLVSLFQGTFRPYKADYMTYCELTIFLLLGVIALLLFVWLQYPIPAYATLIISICLLPHCALIAYVAYILFQGKKIVSWVKRRITECAGACSVTEQVLQSLNSFRAAGPRMNEDDLPHRFLHPDGSVETLTNYSSINSE